MFSSLKFQIKNKSLKLGGTFVGETQITICRFLNTSFRQFLFVFWVVFFYIHVWTIRTLVGRTLLTRPTCVMGTEAFSNTEHFHIKPRPLNWKAISTAWTAVTCELWPSLAAAVETKLNVLTET